MEYLGYELISIIFISPRDNIWNLKRQFLIIISRKSAIRRSPSNLLWNAGDARPPLRLTRCYYLEPDNYIRRGFLFSDQQTFAIFM